jgi:hypothetical protein
MRNRGSITASFTLHFPAGGEDHRHLQKKKNTQARELKRKDLLATGWKAVLSVAEKEKA